MQHYLLLKDLHMALAIISGVYFGARGVWRLGLRRPIRTQPWRSLPHLIDTLLLASGLALALLAGLAPHGTPWFGIKLVWVVAYIALGIAAFRARQQAAAWLYYGGALLIWLWIIGIALRKTALSWLG